MKAAVYEGDGRVSVRDLPLPALAQSQVRVKIESDTICGTDLRIATGAKSKGVTPPVVLGHEVAGTIVDVGAAVSAYRVGDRVGMSPELVCGHCDSCQRGVFNLCRRAVRRVQPDAATPRRDQAVDVGGGVVPGRAAGGCPLGRHPRSWRILWDTCR